MHKTDFRYYDLREQRKSADIQTLFPGWRERDERVIIFSPHDDDAAIGPGYGLLAALANEGEVYICIFCNGQGGYSRPEEKDTIVERRHRETLAAYRLLGVDESHIIRFDWPDLSVGAYLGWLMPWGGEGTTGKVVPFLRQVGATRLVLPNGYHEHFDHEAVHRIGIFDGPLVGDAILAEWGVAEPIRSYHQYAVWGDLSPEDALLDGRSQQLRATHALLATIEAERKIQAALSVFASQRQVIKDLMAARQSRRHGDWYLELYQTFNPRRLLDYAPYHRLIDCIDQVAQG